MAYEELRAVRAQRRNAVVVLVVRERGRFRRSALVTPGGTASHVVAAGVAGRFEYLLCPRLVGELVDVVGRLKIARVVAEEQPKQFVAAIAAAGLEVDDPARIPAVSRDPDDDYLFACRRGARRRTNRNGRRRPPRCHRAARGGHHRAGFPRPRERCRVKLNGSADGIVWKQTGQPTEQR